MDCLFSDRIRYAGRWFLSASWWQYHEDPTARIAGQGNRIAVGIGGSGLVGGTAAILEAGILGTGNIRNMIMREDRICPSGMEQGCVGRKDRGRG
jgi:hypothetical protein